MEFDYDPSQTTTSLIWAGVEEDPEVVARLQLPWEVPELVAVKADIGHEHGPDDVVRHAVECFRAGACAVHLHIRDSQGKDTGDIELWRDVIARIRSSCEDVVIDSGLRGSSFKERMSHVREGLFDVVPVIPTWESAYLRASIQEMETHCVRPEFVVWDFTDISLVKSQLADLRSVRENSLWLLVPGTPYYGMPVPDPSFAFRGIMLMVDAIRAIDPSAHISVSASGRSSSYATTFALLLGLHIRPGTGETHWRYPHDADLNTEDPLVLVSDALQVASLLGRKPASSREYRKIIAFK